MEGPDGEIEPGFYQFSEDEVGGAIAEVDQKRAEILDIMRTSKCFTVCALDDENNVLHASFVLGIDGHGGNQEPISFLAYAALKNILDLANVLGKDVEQTIELLQHIINNGGGKWL